VRPVNLKTDLPALADLIELAFASTMDSGGRAAIREMRALSHVGAGLHMLSHMNEMMQGVGLGYVYMHDGRLAGNVSIYPASLPPEARPGSIIANVAVHPDYRGRGIARALMLKTLETLEARAAPGTTPTALLQVEADNFAAYSLYYSLGFYPEGTWTTWRRPAGARVPPPLAGAPYMAHRGRGAWRGELALARRVRPDVAGGIGWLRPLVPSVFQRGLLRWLGDMFNLRSIERLLIAAPDTPTASADTPPRGVLWIESGFAAATQLTLFTAEGDREAAEALLVTAVRRFGVRDALTIEHPHDDPIAGELLADYGFVRQRTLTHMRWQPRPKHSASP
jgi:GNAT superfamily N-acetyltransferase